MSVSPEMRNDLAIAFKKEHILLLLYAVFNNTNIFWTKTLFSLIFPHSLSVGKWTLLSLACNYEKSR